jgi:hypothetical protein
MNVITHRGLDAEKHHDFTESSKESFQFFLDAGFGLEFDVQITKDGTPVISHDISLSRLTGTELPLIVEQTTTEFLNTLLPNGSTLTLTELTEMMEATKSKTISTHALHLKVNNQSSAQLQVLRPFLSKLINLPLIVFDVKPDVARSIKEQFPTLPLAASVAHPFDARRYGAVVGDTLIPTTNMVTLRSVYDWCWLDEWDRTDEHGEKSLYNAETFSFLRDLGYKLAVVSPELHRTSPKLLGGESHQDAQDYGTLKKRWVEIVELEPDAICTDYPFYHSRYE